MRSAAWMAPQPTLHILAVQTRTSPYEGLGSVLPDLLNVVDLGRVEPGLSSASVWRTVRSLELVEYQDGMDLRQMRLLQSIGAGE